MYVLCTTEHLPLCFNVKGSSGFEVNEAFKWSLYGRSRFHLLSISSAEPCKLLMYNTETHSGTTKYMCRRDGNLKLSDDICLRASCFHSVHSLRLRGTGSCTVACSF
jgi:hypothetical protein